MAGVRHPPLPPHQGPIFAEALAKILARVKIEIVKRSDQAKGFMTLPKRWIVERTIAWLNRCRRWFEGPCPAFGGDDRFSINLQKRVWSCRQCPGGKNGKNAGGDAIDLVRQSEN